ncbi:uncharacterized protein LOC114365961 [Ostrinia furnacalis]|uniref:uncharacterized protein LOC114365961 n=1 Tax=Ostrinia furnacalis TaxID=93504 RepID=UPI00103E53E2|nr:uncharacterized protein LOC114365961 [Ostrinia furnacalis]
MVAMDQEFNIRFVQEIEKHPCLWNFRMPDYARRDITEKTWYDIGKKFRITVQDCKDRWKNLRGVFARHLRTDKDASVRRRPYYLAEFMQFAIPFIKIPGSDKKIKPNMKLEDEIPLDDQELQLQSSIEVQLSPAPSPSIEQSLYAATVYDPETQIPKKQRKKCEETVFEDVIASYFKLKQSRMFENSENGEHKFNKMFLLSVLPDMNKMNDRQRRTFKRKVLQAVDETMDEDSE